MVKDLNNLFKTSTIIPCKYRPRDVVTLKTNPVKSKDDWSEKCFTSLKKHLRKEHYKIQKRRCVYCRRQLNPVGINEHIDHIVARSLRVGWMFKPRNLVLSCYQCNTQKSAAPVLKRNNYKRLPRRKQHYTLYNPYVHRWHEHFEIEDSIFIKARSKIGENTIRELKLYDYKYSIVYANESNIQDSSAIKRATKRLVSFKKKSIEYKSAKKLIKEIERHI